MEKVKAVADGSASFVSGFVPPLPPVMPDSWTASTPPVNASAPTAAPMPLIDVLDELAQQVEGVRGAILASVDGFGLARSTSMADAVASRDARCGCRPSAPTRRDGWREQPAWLVVDHDAGLMLVWPIGTQRVLAVLASTRVDQRQLRSIVQRHATILAGATP